MNENVIKNEAGKVAYEKISGTEAELCQELLAEKINSNEI